MRVGCGFKMGAKHWSKEEIDILANLNKQGLNYREISKLIETRTYESCLGMANRLELQSSEKSNVDVNFFQRNDEISNYVLGYWLADGCIMKKSGGYYFSLVSIDKEHLLKIKNVMKLRNKLHKNSGNAYEIRVGSKKLVQSIIELGGKYNKTEIIKFDDFDISDKFFYDFLRGYFDGDGSICVSNFIKKDGSQSIDKIKFTGSENVIRSLHLILGDKYKCYLYKDSRGNKNNCWYLTLCGNDMRKLLDKMYGNATIYLDRKYNLFKNLKEEYYVSNNT